MVDIEKAYKASMTVLTDEHSDYALGFKTGIAWLYHAITGNPSTGGYKEPCKKK